jgi:hypothetical protein
MTGLSAPRRTVAQEPVSEGQAPASAQQDQAAAEDLESPEVNDYLWIAGSSFKPRASNVAYQYMSNGCITSLTGGSALNQSFTAPFRVPDGSVIRGVRFYYYDTSAQDSRMSITSYDGAGDYIDHIVVDSTGSAGVDNVYAALGTPYTIDTADRGFVLNWYPYVAGSTMRLCGARVFYDRGTPVAQADAAAEALPADAISDEIAPTAPNALDYYFLAGSSFNRRDSKTTYQYGASGCIYTASGSSLFTIDVNMPDGVRVLGARFYYYDTSAADSIQFFLTDYTGLGDFRNLLSGSSSDGGFGSAYVAMGASYDPYTVDQATYSLNAIATGADKSSVQLCGVRVFYQTLAAQADQPAGEEAVAATTLTASDMLAPEPDITALPAKDYAHDLELPQGAVAQGLRVYYYNTQTPDGYVQTWNYTGSTADFLGSTTTSDHSGYSSTYQAFGTPYTVNYLDASLGVVPWVATSSGYRFCGVRVYYTQGLTPRYRFIAGSSFHPRNSATRFTYEGTGCISIEADRVELPFITN